MLTLNDLERRNGIYACTSLLYFVVRERRRRKESSRSLSNLLMSFLYLLFRNYRMEINAHNDKCVIIITVCKL